MTSEIKHSNPRDHVGGASEYYQLPPDAAEMQDLIEYRQMNFAQGNIFKAIYRLGQKGGTSYAYDLNKIIWYAQRELNRLGEPEWVSENKAKPTTTSTTAQRKPRNKEPLATRLDATLSAMGLSRRVTEKK